MIAFDGDKTTNENDGPTNECDDPTTGEPTTLFSQIKANPKILSLVRLAMNLPQKMRCILNFSHSLHIESIFRISDFGKFQELSKLKIVNHSKPQFYKMFSRSLLLVGATSLVAANLQPYQNILPAQPVVAPIANGLGANDWGSFHGNAALASNEDGATDLTTNNSAMSKYVPDVIEGYNSARKPVNTIGPLITLDLGRIIEEFHDLGDVKVKEILNQIVTGFDRLQSETSNAYVPPTIKAKALQSAIKNADIESIIRTLRGASSEDVERALSLARKDPSQRLKATFTTLPMSVVAFYALFVYFMIIKNMESYLLPKIVKPIRTENKNLIVPDFIEIAFVAEIFSNNAEIDDGSPQIFFIFSWIDEETVTETKIKSLSYYYYCPNVYFSEMK
ncbi:hypothetical protein ROZALSC1DRAFT_22735 [Rozella allomycis CSF55]|uniref:Uncharacterized protein n=1 Tax=Rozella allomycis (strain CSF55) TaxID=988480 RepID=A0A4P9YHB5_ROZAC|nr:hypothetical protein ROZALSC1DRAFT_25224 [Rozella allomycis CSF55]RKP18953.1 hypothetical protein ROZALSC1DRAFT_22735 [Rozella allomycis CSF55]